MAAPIFSVNDQVYLKESAARGFLEGLVITGIVSTNAGWRYTYAHPGQSPRPEGPLFGDRIVFKPTPVIYVAEDELVVLCDALDLARSYHTDRLAEINAMIAERC